MKMDKQIIEAELIELQKAKIQLAEIIRGYDEMRSKLIPAELQQELADLEAERIAATEGLATKVSNLEQYIKDNTLELGESVKVNGVGSAVYCKGRVSWNNDGLEGLMVAIPELAQFRKQGDPYVQLKGA